MSAGRETQHRNILVATKVNATERERIDRAARAEGITRSAVIRRAVLRDLRRSDVTTGKAEPAQ